MIDKIDISGHDYKISDSFKKYTIKRLGKLDRFLPRGKKKDVVMKVIVSEVNHPHGNKYEVSAAMEVLGGKVITAKDECSNVFAGIDILEAKLKGQIRRFKLEATPHTSKKGLRSLFIKRQ